LITLHAADDPPFERLLRQIGVSLAFGQADGFQGQVISLKSKLKPFHRRHSLPNQYLLPVINADAFW
jgi:hypothetical protein